MRRIEQARTAERKALLASIVRKFHDDQRLLAFWLEGSLGRGRFDAWSDLDMWTVARDEDFESVVADRYRIIETIGDLVLTVESPQNGPSGGFYLMAGFDCPTGIQLVDWYCQPASKACQPRSESVVFVRPELAESKRWQSTTPEDGIELIFRRQEGSDDSIRLNQPYVAWHPSEEEERVNSGYLAWAMIAIQAKQIVRAPHAAGLQFETFIANLVAKASSHKQTLRPSTVDAAKPGEKLDRLIDLSGGLIRVLPAHVKLQESILRTLSAARHSLPRADR
ncbi:MAG: hypothetical protein P4L46_10745 [Fimbriimonas sp.]|nr:hypothetical protein [Fimbriimonas sp.]